MAPGNSRPTPLDQVGLPTPIQTDRRPLYPEVRRQMDRAIVTTGAPGQDTILYDGHCRLCRGAAGHLRRLVPAGKVSLASFREPAVLARFPGVSLERCEAAMQYVRADGTVYEGAAAVVQALRHRWLGKLALVYYLPGIRQLADALYRLVARYRFRIAGRTCDDAGCAVHLR